MPDALTTAQPFVCGGLSACFASSIVHPVDLAKVRLQLFAVQHSGMPRPSFPEIISTMVKKEGISSIYSGLSAALARQCVYGTARIGLHRTFSDLLQKRNDGKPLNFGYKALRFDSVRNDDHKIIFTDQFSTNKTETFFRFTINLSDYYLLLRNQNCLCILIFLYLSFHFIYLVVWVVGH